MKIALVIPWFGKDLKGGAEQQAWQIANRLAEKGIEVHVLTTCSRDFLSDWSENFYKPGTYIEGKLTIHRFPVKKRKKEIFDSINAKLLSFPKEKLIPGVSPLTQEEEEIYLYENIFSKELISYLEVNREKFDAFIFIPYLFPTSILGVKKVKEKAILQPCLHDECYAYLNSVREMFCSAAKIFCNSKGEQELIKKLYGTRPLIKSEVIGEGIEIDPQIFDEYSEEPLIKEDYILYLGRRDRGKNVHLLIEAFEDFVKQTKSKLKLVLAGVGDLPVPLSSKQILDLGLVTEEQKINLLRYCKALVNPSQNESFSRVIYEAWFAKKPVIIHKDCLATYKALEESGFAGFACRNKEEFIETFKLINQLSGYEILKKGIKGHKYAAELAAWDKVIERYFVALSIFTKEISFSRKNKISNQKSRINIIITYFSVVEDDAVGNDVLQQYSVLRERGYNVSIYADEFCPNILKRNDIQRLEWNKFLHIIKDENTILIYHHANYWPKGDIIFEEAKCKIFFKYHNITPPSFFEKYSPEIAASVRKGREQTKRLIESAKIILALPDSSFNGRELSVFGISDKCIKVLPPFHKIDKFCCLSLNRSLFFELKSHKINILFVGRVAPNKGHKFLIETIKEYVKFYGENIRLFIVGGLDPQLMDYYNELQNLTERYFLRDIVSFKGRVSFQDLYTYYKAADVFLLMSEHEGFCVPILEAQFCQVPIIALNRGAVQETLGKEQLIFDELDYALFASAIHLVAKHKDIRKYLIDQGIRNFQRFSFENIKKKFLEILDLYV